MALSVHATASSIRAILCFIDANQTPKIAFDNDGLSIPLIQKIKKAVGDLDGSKRIVIIFSDEEAELQRQFSEVCKNIQNIFYGLSFLSTL